MEEDAKRLAGGAIENLYGGGGGGGFEVDPIGDTIRNAIQEAQDAASSLWENFTGALSEVWDNVVGALQEGWSSFLEFGSDILNDIAKFAEDTFESIRKFFEDAMKDCENAADHFSSAASSAIAALNDVISSLADNIRTNMIGAIDEASARWQAFQQEVALGNAAIAASAADYSRAGSYSNTNSTEWNVTLNGVQNGDEAASRFRQGVGSRFSTNNFNPGIRG
jgi:phage-related protein